ncbi:MAG: type II toxin-antitoxin system RelE/ParE family toxin [Tepidisphaeraceae bacterium]
MPEPAAWNVEITDEYHQWFQTLANDQQDAVRSDIALLEKMGPSLGRPYVDSLKGSKHSNMKELRTMHHRRHIRTFFAFDPRRTAILLVGGDKTGRKSFYGRMLPLADHLFDEYLLELRKEGLI